MKRCRELYHGHVIYYYVIIVEVLMIYNLIHYSTILIRNSFGEILR